MRRSYSREEEEFIMEHFPADVEILCERFGVSRKVLHTKVSRMRAKGLTMPLSQRDKEQESVPNVIIDGYDTVPWHMRITNRRQYYIPVDHHRLTLDE